MEAYFASSDSNRESGSVQEAVLLKTSMENVLEVAIQQTVVGSANNTSVC